ncbi:MAG: SO_0444 family Cu/Zn efflux transporter [Candidatus Hydrogenedentes bacterium]|nr:SO_0444 family Cu/Zn efflux transporter [Candidatus Hydrogenedentota bacterium]
MNIFKEYFNNTIAVYLQMSPYLLFGFLVAGLLYKLIPQSWVKKHLSGDGYLPIFKSAVLGIPLPLCSCGVIPVMASLRKQGANIPAMLSFLLSTPQTGVDSILATYALLGLPLAVYRPVIALITAMIGGIAYYILMRKGFDAQSIDKERNEGQSYNEVPHNNGTVEKSYWMKCIFDAINYGFVTLPRDIVKPLLLGMLVAGFVTTFLPPGFVANYFSSNVLQILFAVLIGIPIYVCATASIPIALGLIHIGITPGAALAFLISGPATNLATVGVVRKFLGSRALIVYVLTMVFSAFVFGLSFDYFVNLYPNLGISDFSHVQFAHTEHIDVVGYVHIISSILLTIVFVVSFSSIKLSAFFNAHKLHSDEEVLEFLIEGMSCENCVERVKKILRSIPKVKYVVVTINPQRALVYGSPSVDEVKNRLSKEGYKASFVGLSGSLSGNTSFNERKYKCSCCE